MRNLTIQVDEESYRMAKVAAAERDTSVSRLIRDYFRSLGQTGRNRKTDLQHLFQAMDAVKSPAPAAGRERDRAKLYER